MGTFLNTSPRDLQIQAMWLLASDFRGHLSFEYSIHYHTSFGSGKQRALLCGKTMGRGRRERRQAPRVLGSVELRDAATAKRARLVSSCRLLSCHSTQAPTDLFTGAGGMEAWRGHLAGPKSQLVSSAVGFKVSPMLLPSWGPHPLLCDGTARGRSAQPLKALRPCLPRV